MTTGQQATIQMLRDRVYQEKLRYKDAYRRFFGSEWLERQAKKIEQAERELRDAERAAR